jgi:hypothetical protein
MEKKKRDTMLPKRFNADDIKNWQKSGSIREIFIFANIANSTTLIIY